MFLTPRSVGLTLCLCSALAACSLQIPSENEVFGSAGAKASASGGAAADASGGSGMLGDAGEGGGEPKAGSAGSGTPSSGGSKSAGGANGSAGAKGSAGGPGAGGAGGTKGSGGAAGSNGFDPNAGLVAYFTFDETGGATVANSKDSTKNGKCVGTCSRPQGQIGNALGVRNNLSPSDWVELPVGIFNGRSAITLSLWLRDLSMARSEAPLFHFSTSASEAFYLLPDDDRASATGAHLVGVHNGSSFVNLSSATPSLTDKVWHQVVVTWNSSKLELYIDGNSVASLANPKSLPSYLGANSINYLGRSRDDTKLAMFGEFDDLRIYDRVLSAADVMSLYKVR